jgi:hypothetical protein
VTPGRHACACGVYKMLFLTMKRFVAFVSATKPSWRVKWSGKGVWSRDENENECESESESRVRMRESENE